MERWRCSSVCVRVSDNCCTGRRCVSQLGFRYGIFACEALLTAVCVRAQCCQVVNICERARRRKRVRAAKMETEVMVVAAVEEEEEEEVVVVVVEEEVVVVVAEEE